MFYLLYPLADVFSPFNLFRYLTFRSIAAFLTALVLSFLIGGGLIRWLRSKQKQGQPIRDDGPASHLVNKKGTPTMGGLLILITLTDRHPAVGRPHQPLCLDRARRHPDVRRGGLLGRLPQGHQAQSQGRAGQAETRAVGRGGRASPPG